jgi:hypothetical protein
MAKSLRYLLWDIVRKIQNRFQKTRDKKIRPHKVRPSKPVDIKSLKLYNSCIISKE